MSESLDNLNKLAKFTPTAGTLDRDAVMFAAGKASVRSGKIWPALAGLLAMSQLATLVFLWPNRQTTIEPSIPFVQQPETTSMDEKKAPISPVPGSILWYRTGESRPETLSFGHSEIVSSGPIMRVGTLHLND